MPKKARACPECGSDEQTGWSEEAETGGLGLSEDDFEYDEFVRNEFSSERDIKPRGLHWVWWMTGIALLAAMLIWLLR